MRLLLTLCIVLLALMASAQFKPTAIPIDSTIKSTKQIVVHDVTMFPKLENLKKHVIFLESESNEKELKLELFAIKKAEVDDCNSHFLMGKFESIPLEGYGYHYYMFNTNGNVISTKKACVNNHFMLKNIESSKKETIEYNSNIPQVIYAPEGVEIFYRIWRRDQKVIESTLYE